MSDLNNNLSFSCGHFPSVEVEALNGPLLQQSSLAANRTEAFGCKRQVRMKPSECQAE